MEERAHDEIPHFPLEAEAMEAVGDTFIPPEWKQMDVGLKMTINDMRRAYDTLTSSMNRVDISTRLYVIKDLETYEMRREFSMKTGYHGQTMRFAAYIVYARARKNYFLRVDDTLSGIVTYAPIDTDVRILVKDRAANIKNRIIAALAGILQYVPDDWRAIWSDYSERVDIISPDVFMYTDQSISEYLHLIEKCPDNSAISRVDLHLMQKTYDALRFSVMGSGIESITFQSDNQIYVSDVSRIDYGSAIAENLLENFINIEEVSKFARRELEYNGIDRLQQTVVAELKNLQSYIDNTSIDKLNANAKVLQRIHDDEEMFEMGDGDGDGGDFFVSADELKASEATWKKENMNQRSHGEVESDVVVRNGAVVYV